MNNSFFSYEKQQRLINLKERQKKEQQYKKNKKQVQLIINKPRMLQLELLTEKNILLQSTGLIEEDNEPMTKLEPSEEYIPYIVDKNITINIVYQYSYKNKNVTGLGDFIRGCFFMLQFSEKNNINVEFEIYEHPIKKYFEYFQKVTSNLNENISKNIIFFDINNHDYNTHQNVIYYNYLNIDNKLTKFLNILTSYNNHIYLYLVNHPDEHFITQEHKNKICNMFKPNSELDNAINLALTNLKLVKKTYSVIHLRLFDECFYTNGNTNINVEQLHYIINSIKFIRNKTKNDILLISNSNYFKNIILRHIPTLKSYFFETTHISDISLNNENNVLNTLKDFFIMSHSNYIYAFSVYGHGSGFSKWCSVAYNIPYVCYRIK